MEKFEEFCMRNSLQIIHISILPLHYPWKVFSSNIEIKHFSVKKQHFWRNKKNHQRNKMHLNIFSLVNQKTHPKILNHSKSGSMASGHAQSSEHWP